MDASDGINGRGRGVVLSSRAINLLDINKIHRPSNKFREWEVPVKELGRDYTNVSYPKT